MDCDFCGENIEDKGLLISTGGLEKQWACTDCFVEALIKGRADIIHHWGFIEEKAKPEPKPGEESPR